jgi:soluble lytic murein transglycosylase-like protein
MPVIPIYQQESRARMVEGPRAEGMRVSDAVGVGLQQLGQGADALAQGLIVQKVEHDTTAVNEAYSVGYSSAMRKVLYDPQGGYFSKQGRDALTALPTLEGSLTEAAKSVRDGLQNDNQRRIFDEMTRKNIASELAAANRHAEQQNQVWQTQTSNAVLDNHVQNALTRYNDPKYVDGEIAGALYEVQSFGSLRGQSAETMAKRARDTIRAIRTGVADRMLQSDPLAAEKYVKEHEGELAGPEFPVLLSRVKAAALPVAAKQDADAVMKAAKEAKLTAEMQQGGTAATSTATVGDFAPAVVQHAPTIEAAANANGVDPRILMGLIHAESRGNNDAVSPKGARGIAQFMPDTATRYGVDVTKPESGIKGAARYLSDNLQMFGGDYAKALAGYNWGEGNVKRAIATYGDGWLSHAPAETQKYVNGILGAAPPQNVRDVRAQVGDLVQQAQAAAEKTRPGDILYRDMVVQQVRGALALDVAKVEAEQRQAYGALMQASLGVGGRAPTTLTELLTIPNAREAFSKLDGPGQRGIIGLLEHNAKAATGEFVKSDPFTVQELHRRIWAEENSADKIRNAAQLAPYFGKVNRTDIDWLTKQLETARSPEGNGFARDANRVATTAKQMMRAGIVGQMLAQTQPERLESAALAFQIDLDNKIDAYRKAGKDPRLLITPNTPDYVLKPEVVASYLQQTPAQAVAGAAQAVKVSATREASGKIGGVPAPKPGETPATAVPVKDEAEYNALGKGAYWIDPRDGKVKRKA